MQVLTERELLGGDSERGPVPVEDAQDGAETAQPSDANKASLA